MEVIFHPTNQLRCQSPRQVLVYLTTEPEKAALSRVFSFMVKIYFIICWRACVCMCMCVYAHVCMCTHVYANAHVHSDTRDRNRGQAPLGHRGRAVGSVTNILKMSLSKDANNFNQTGLDQLNAHVYLQHSGWPGKHGWGELTQNPKTTCSFLRQWPK